MFKLNIKTEATTAAAAAAAASPTVIDVDTDDSFESVPSSGGGQDGGVSPRSLPSPQPADVPQSVDYAPYPHCPIFIPSKGRSDLDRSTMATFVRDLVPFVLVVEEEEAVAYSALLDRLVGQAFGFAGMVYSSPVTGGEDEKDGGEGVAGDGSTSSPTSPARATTPGESSSSSSSNNTASAAVTEEATAADLWDFPCACCHALRGPTSGAPSPSAAVELLAQRLSSAFHHGYVFEPPTQAPATGGSADGSAEAADAQLASGRTSQGAAAQLGAPGASSGGRNSSGSSAAGGPRTPSAAFVLHDVTEIRALFQVEVLPESNRGVSYVRNYILQVLVPRVMVACGVDRSGHLEELCLSGPGEHSTLTPAALRSARLEPDVYDALQTRSAIETYLDERRRRRTSPQPAAAAGGQDAASRESTATGDGASRDTPRLLHGLFGFYWVLDDDIYGFYATQAVGQKQQRLSSRAMLREVEGRLRRLRRNADHATQPPPAVPPATFMSASASAAASSATVMASPVGAGPSPNGFVAPQHVKQQHYLFTGKEDVLANNYIASGQSKLLTMQNYTLYYTTACFSLEYVRFAIGARPSSLAVNSYNNIACLFNYTLLHNPPQMRYFPPNVVNVRRPEDALVGYLGHSMLWYRFAVREDYDFTLQLIARGLCTLRFRGLAFDVPQMMKVRGGMTDYYKNCHDEIRQQNDRLVLQWPAVAQHWVKGKDDKKRDDIRVQWQLLSPARAKYPGAFLYLNTPLPQLQPQRMVEEGGSTSPEAPANTESALDAPAEARKRQRPEAMSEVPRAAPRPLAPPPPLTTIASQLPPPPSESHGGGPTPLPQRRGGYVVERWREIDADEAQLHVGLVPLPNEDIHIGQTVAVIPPFFTQQPSVVLATVIERSLMEEAVAERAHVMWTAVAQDVRGMPFLHVRTCYRPPVEGIVAAAQKLDQYFARVDASEKPSEE